MPLARELKGELSGKGLRVAIVVSRYNEFVTRKLLDGTHETLLAHGVEEGDLTIAWVPGSLELGVVAKALAQSQTYDAIIGLGAVIRGETGHYEVVARESTAALSRVALDTGIPVAMGVLTTENIEQAMDRVGGKAGNKGHDAAVTAVEMANLMRLIKKKE